MKIFILEGEEWIGYHIYSGEPWLNAYESRWGSWHPLSHYRGPVWSGNKIVERAKGLYIKGIFAAQKTRHQEICEHDSVEYVREGLGIYDGRAYDIYRCIECGKITEKEVDAEFVPQ